MLRRMVGLVSCYGLIGWSQPVFRERVVAELKGETIAGCALDGRTLFTWGGRLLSWHLPDGARRVLLDKDGYAFLEGGCLLDVDGDGKPDLIVNEGPASNKGPASRAIDSSRRALIWIDLAHGRRHVIDTGVDAPDVIPATLLGHRGVLLIHRRNQVRFYEIPKDPSARWPSRDIYSFYTPSDQGGLLLTDVDGDSLPDIIAGNYWIQSPKKFDLPWRLFAIDTWSETQHSAMQKLALADLWRSGARNLIALQRDMPAARLAWFEKPADPKQLWNEHALEKGCENGLELGLALNRPHSLDVADFNGDGLPDVLVAESAGAGRLIIFENRRDGRFAPRVITQGVPIHYAGAIHLHRERKPEILVITPHRISRWQPNLAELAAQGHLNISPPKRH